MGPGRTDRRTEAPSLLVDARTLNTSGLGRYLREILAAIVRDPRFGEVVLLGETGALLEFAMSHDAGSRVRAVEYPCELYSPRVQLSWMRLQASRSVQTDLAFFPHYDAPLVGLPCNSVLTVHDLTHFKVPELFTGWRRAAARVMLARAVRQARKIITVSEATRADLVEVHPEIAGKVEVVPNGVSSLFLRTESVRPTASAGSGPYLLCVGNRKPHKNLPAAVEVLARVRSRHPDLRLVIVGKKYPGWDAVRERARELGVSEWVEEMDEVSDVELRDLYAHCEVLLAPSLYEGFGLPAVEAMATGAPVVASNRSSLPEVVGEAGLLVDPQDLDGMADAVGRILEDPGLRDRLCRMARARAESFSWTRSASRTLDILLSMSSSSPRAPRPGDRACVGTSEGARLHAEG